MLTWSSPYRIGGGFKPQIAIKPTGYIISSRMHRNDTDPTKVGIMAQEFDNNGQAVTNYRLIQPAYEGDPIDSHFAAWSNGSYHLFYTPTNPRRLMYSVNGGSAIDFGQTYFNNRFACYNDNAVCSDAKTVYAAIMQYKQPVNEIVVFESLWDKFVEIGRYQGVKTPCIAKSGNLLVSFAKSNQAEPAKGEFNYLVLNTLAPAQGQVRGSIQSDQVNGGMACATNGTSALLAFGRNTLKLYLYQAGQIQNVANIPAGDIAGDGIGAVALHDGSYLVAWNDKNSLKSYYALSSENWQKRELWSIGGDTATVLECELGIAQNRVVWAAIGGTNRQLFTSSAPVAGANREYEIMFTNGTITGVEGQRILDTRGGTPINNVAREVNTNRATAKAVIATITAVGALGGGHFRAFPANLVDSPTSCLNYGTGLNAIANTTIIPLFDGKFKLVSGGAMAHAIVDVLGFVE